MPKQGALSDGNNYRSVCLAHAISKIFKPVITDRLHTFLEGKCQLRARGDTNFDLVIQPVVCRLCSHAHGQQNSGSTRGYNWSRWASKSTSTNLHKRVVRRNILLLVSPRLVYRVPLNCHLEHILSKTLSLIINY